jgi:hypothetical protein
VSSLVMAERDTVRILTAGREYGSGEAAVQTLHPQADAGPRDSIPTLPRTGVLVWCGRVYPLNCRSSQCFVTSAVSSNIISTVPI